MQACAQCRYFNNIKEYLPHLFYGFRNKYFDEISLDNMLYMYHYWENAWFFHKYAKKNSLQNKTQISYFLMASKNTYFDHVCHAVMYR